MISQDRDYEDILRDALCAAAESVEPASGGLERIRHRSHSRRSARSMLAGAADWLRLYRIRLSVRLESFRWELSQRGIGPPPAGPDHDGRTPTGKTAARLGPAAAWLKPAFAVAAVVAVVVVGVVTLNRMQEAVITPTNSVTSPGQQQGPAGATPLASTGLWQVPLGVNPSPKAGTSRKKAGANSVPAVACTPTPAASSSASASASPSASPTPAPTDSGTASATPTPTVTSSPSDTPTTGSGGGTATSSGNSTAHTTADVVFTPDVHCGSAPKAASPKVHATS